VVRRKKLVRCVVMEGWEGVDEYKQVAQEGREMEVRKVVRVCVPDLD
jgi:hypothetical protein